LAELTQTSQSTQSLLTNIPHVLSIILVLLVVASFYVQGGIDEVTTIRGLVSAMAPIIFPIGIISLYRSRYRRIARRQKDWQYDVLAFAAFIVSLLIMLALPGREADPVFLDIYSLIAVTSGQAFTSLYGFSIIAIMFRTYIARDRYVFWTLLMTIVGLFTSTPIFDLFLPPAADFGRWIQSYVQAAIDVTIYEGYQIATIALLVNMILFREKLRPA
jgi:hypothetical protein